MNLPSVRECLKYGKQLYEKYAGFIQLNLLDDFLGYDVAVPHLCKLCGCETSTRPRTLLNLIAVKDEKTKHITYKKSGTVGNGCIVCRSTETHMKQLAAFQKELEVAHKGKFSLVGLPLRFERNSGKYKQSFVCNDCGCQHYQTPDAIVDPSFTCRECVTAKRLGERTKFYTQRLNSIYGQDRIMCQNRYQDNDRMIHRCSKGHLWLDDSVTMLNGSGCPTCKNAVEIKSIAPVRHRNREYLFRTEREARALKAMIKKLDGKVRMLRTSRSFPTPILFGKNSVAFYDSKTRLAVDVMSEKTFRANLKRKIPRSIDKAKELGLTYGVILVTPKKVIGVWDKERLLGKRDITLKEEDDFDEAAPIAKTEPIGESPFKE